MPVILDAYSLGAGNEASEGAAFEATRTSWTPTLVERVNVPYITGYNYTSQPTGLIEAMTVDPWSQAGQYGLGWLYFCIVLLAFTLLRTIYGLYNDKIRTAMYRDQLISTTLMSPETQYEMSFIDTDKSTNKLFPRTEPSHMEREELQTESHLSSSRPLNLVLAAFRFVFYRPTPSFSGKKGSRPLSAPSLAVVGIVSAAFIFTVLYTFIQQPLYWQSMAYGSPPVAIRSGMLAISMIPWIVLLSMKANFVSMLTGIGHERLNVLHRWGGWLCLFLSLVHAVPFYVQEMQDPAGYTYWSSLINTRGVYIYGTGFAALAPLIFLCLHSLPWLRRLAYELFLLLHVPASIVFVAMLIWHCNNYLASWNYLWATIAIWVASYVIRFVFHLNWSNPWRMSSWLVGDEASVFLLPENAVKVTIPTKMRWRPGQYVYLRMPGVSIFENHPFTITSLCSDDFPSEYGEGYRDMVLVFRPFGGFTKRVLQAAVENGPWHSYRAFLDGPYGGMSRNLYAFDHVVMIAGGSGITALTSHLLDLIKKMRDGKATTRRIHIIWAMKRPDVMDWFREELRICREFAPPDSVTCNFYITAAKRLGASGQLVSATTPSRPMSGFFHEKVNNTFQDIANKRSSHLSHKSGHSQMIHDEAADNAERELELRREREDQVSALPQRHVVPIAPHAAPDSAAPSLHHPLPSHTHHAPGRNLTLDVEQAHRANPDAIQTAQLPSHGDFDFGFPSTPTDLQKNLMRFAFLPATTRARDGWQTEYGRPDIPFALRQLSRDFGARTCVFVCGPPAMRLDVAESVAALQLDVLRDARRQEIYLHTENYAI